MWPLLAVVPEIPTFPLANCVRHALKRTAQCVRIAKWFLFLRKIIQRNCQFTFCRWQMFHVPQSTHTHSSLIEWFCDVRVIWLTHVSARMNGRIDINKTTNDLGKIQTKIFPFRRQKQNEKKNFDRMWHASKISLSHFVSSQSVSLWWDVGLTQYTHHVQFDYQFCFVFTSHPIFDDAKMPFCSV